VKSINQQRLAAFQGRFPNRENLSLEALYDRYFAKENLPKTESLELMTLLADELALPVGMLRPEDTMADVLQPVISGNPLRWIEEWTRAADGKAELNDRLRRRLTELGTLDRWQDLPTIADVVRAWCGRLPSNGSQHVPTKEAR
jgi:hypothetical protein